MTAVRTVLGVALAFTGAAGIHGYQSHAVNTAPVLVGCADGPTCAVPITTGPTRTVNIRWVQHPVVPASQQPIGPDPGADL